MPSMAWCDYIHVLCTFTFKRIKKPGFQPFWRCLARGLPGTFRDCCKRCVVHLLRGLGESNYFHDLGRSLRRTFSLSRMNSITRVQKVPNFEKIWVLDRKTFIIIIIIRDLRSTQKNGPVWHSFKKMGNNVKNQRKCWRNGFKGFWLQNQIWGCVIMGVGTELETF